MHLIVIAVPVIKVIPEEWMSRSWMCQCRRSWRRSLRLSLAGARRQHGWTCMPVRRTVPGRGENGRSPRRAQPVAAALFDDAARTSLLQVLLVFTSFQDTRHDLVRFFGVFFFCRSPCLCCLFCVVSRETKILFFRSASRWSYSELKGKRILRFPFPRLLFNGAQFRSPEVRGFPRLLCGEQFVQQSR